MFITHRGEIISGGRLFKACNAVADMLETNARELYAGDDYISHVSQETKDRALSGSLTEIGALRNGRVRSFAVWQLVDGALTGECVPSIDNEFRGG